MKALRLTVLAAVLVSVLAAVAQSAGNVVVNVPFPFVVANQHMQPGRYVIAPAMDGILRISGANNPIHVPIMRLESNSEGTTKVVFHCYSGSCFMTEVWPGFGQSGKQFFVSERAREIISQRTMGTQPNEVAVLRP